MGLMIFFYNGGYMKKIFFVWLTLAVIIVYGSGCDPKKPGGGGKSQAYDSNTGKYK